MATGSTERAHVRARRSHATIGIERDASAMCFSAEEPSVLAGRCRRLVRRARRDMATASTSPCFVCRSTLDNRFLACTGSLRMARLQRAHRRAGESTQLRPERPAFRALADPAAPCRSSDEIADAVDAVRCAHRRREQRPCEPAASAQGRPHVRPPHRRTPRHPRRGRRMTPPGGAWNEAGQSEDPAIELLEKLGYTYVPPETLDAERDSLRDVVLVARLEAALRRLNPWLSDDNLHKAVRAITSVQATSLIEANEALHTALSFGIALEQDLGEGRKNQQVRFFDFDNAANNDFVVTRQFKVKGARKHVIPDVVVLRERHPARHHRGQEPDARRRLEARSARPVRPLPGAVGQVRRAGRAAVLSHHAVPHRDLRAGRGLRHRRDARALLPALEARAPAHGCRGGEARRQRHDRARRTSCSPGCSRPRTCSTSSATSSCSSATWAAAR